ncbi:peptidylprolyl isomerase [Lacrimispora saccharolytica]|uniref:PpiC-type peptidyl-prolyl cis-trans isomerase n=1 Tax=Lacrimispora saccharolytica (strain ATCC 35040 / DSM 2544 / NRCC 2533 / WM1) TaxID=610130 RepID=D9R8M0_LACSW|nr:peptidylprolyl isomerase [Lacrimispora saccharolytica]ADL05749.1 PpiC-type peptidyl-prolyl cis-trans isomerase [[Clostridium] saccharolyticum WM1]
MKGQLKIGGRVLLAAAVTIIMLSGCRADIPLISETSSTKAYSLPQSMVIVATERNRYQEIYTSQIWGVDLPDGQTFETYLVDQVKEFLQEMKMMNLLARNKGVTLTSAEKEEVRKASEEFFSSLTKEDISYMGAAEEDVRTMYEEYYLSNKVVDELTKDMNLEISDSEAKVIVVEQIVMSDEAEAGEVLLKAGSEGADFSALAREYSEDGSVERKVGRGEDPGPFEDAAFSLSAGQISQVVENKGKYYIIRCVNDYDEDATQERKAGLYQKRKKEAFDQIYSQFKQENPVTFSNEIWKDVKFSKDDRTTTTNFFEIYRKYFSD